jgi:hypothetical protein
MREEAMKAEPSDRKEAWSTPQLRILSVPAQTQSGVVTVPSPFEDDVWYGLS